MPLAGNSSKGGKRCHQRFPDEIEQQKMEGVVQVEGVLGKGTSDKAAAAVVEVDGDEGQAGLPADRQYAEADGGLQGRAVTEDIERQDEAHASSLIVGVQESCRSKQSEEHCGNT